MLVKGAPEVYYIQLREFRYNKKSVVISTCFSD